MNNIRITEATFTEKATIEDGWIRDVKVCGHVSKNGREYTPDALRKGVSLYEGASVYVNHRKGPRDAEERFARMRNVRYVQGDGTRCDLQVLESHPMTPRIKEDLAKGLGFFGLSHVIDARGHQEKGKTIVEEIVKVHCADVVTDAATVTSLREQADGEDPFCAAVMALLAEPGLTKDAFVEKASALWDTLKGDSPATPAEGDAPAEPSPAMEQVMAQVKALTEQVAALSKAKEARYLKPKAAPLTVTEQTSQPGVPADRKALVAWLRKSN